MLCRTLLALTSLENENGPYEHTFQKVPFFIGVSCQLFAYNFANICCTAVKLKVLESLSKMALDKYNFVKFFKKIFGTFWE